MNIMNLEKLFMEKLAAFVGYENAVRIEDFLMIVVILLLGYILGQIRTIYFLKSNFRFNDKAKHLVFQKNEHLGVIEYNFKYPVNFLDRIDLLIGFHIINRNKTVRLSLSKVRWYTRIAICVIIVLIILTILAILLMFNVVKISELINDACR